MHRCNFARVTKSKLVTVVWSGRIEFIALKSICRRLASWSELYLLWGRGNIAKKDGVQNMKMKAIKHEKSAINAFDCYRKEFAEQYYRQCANSVGIAYFGCCNANSLIVVDEAMEMFPTKKMRRP